MKWWSCAVVVVVASSGGTAFAAEFVQQYLRDDGSIILQVDGEGPTRDGKPWDKTKISNSKEEYYHCTYVAKDKDGNVVNKQLLWYFPNDPSGDDDSRSNHWVYWVNPKTQVVWGRCPTPKHPDYNKWKEDKGADLWQVIPKEKRKETKADKDGIDLSKASALFGATVGAEDPEAPRLEPKADPNKQGDPIICVDFTNDTFT